MGAKPPGRSDDNYIKGDNCLTCFAAGQTPKYIQAIVTGVQWIIPKPPEFDVAMPNGIPCVMTQGNSTGGGPLPWTCIWGGWLPCNELPWQDWTYWLVMNSWGAGWFELWLPGEFTMFLSTLPDHTCRREFNNMIVWPVHGGKAYMEWNQSVNKQRADDQAAGYETTDRPSVILRDHKFLDESKNRYEQEFSEDGTSALYLRNRRYGMSMQVHWDEQKYQDSL